ncbi:MAG: hypothetical protein KAH84_10090 [Thiomargarita sp.]|nr:hypothetical protein [Thiomargarita sp.]
MPSYAYKQFRVNMIDVWRLMEAHTELKSTGRNKKKLGHFTRSGIIMLCACWELYTENVLIESIRYIYSNIISPDQLPIDVKKNISNYVKTAKHELKPLELAGDGWKLVYDSYCCEECRKLNTPKTANLQKLYKRFIGYNKVDDLWVTVSTDIDNFVSLRGKIAHNGRASGYIHNWQLRNYTDMITANTMNMDNELCSYLFNIVDNTIEPWRKIKNYG